MGLNALDMDAVHLFVRCTNLDMGSVVSDGVRPFCTSSSTTQWVVNG